MSLFFAYTKPKPSDSDIREMLRSDRRGALIVCDKCGAYLQAGDWPFCGKDNHGRDKK